MAAVTTQDLDDAEQRRVQLPTKKEWANAIKALEEAVEPVINVSWKVKRVAEFRGARAPTLEDIGRVHANSIDLGDRLDELDELVRGVRASLKDLDYVRALSNVPDDDPDA